MWLPKNPLGLIDKDGYLRVPVCRLSDRKGIYVPAHRAIMKFFYHRRLRNEDCIHHADGDRTNNYIGNLYVVDRKIHNSHALQQARQAKR